MDWVLLVRVLLVVAFIGSIVFFIGFAVVKYRMERNERALGFANARGWTDGYAPSNIPRSWIIEGMRVDPNDTNKVIPTWKYNSTYYQNL